MKYYISNHFNFEILKPFLLEIFFNMAKENKINPAYCVPRGALLTAEFLCSSAPLVQ